VIKYGHRRLVWSTREQRSPLYQFLGWGHLQGAVLITAGHSRLFARSCLDPQSLQLIGELLQLLIKVFWERTACESKDE